MEVKEESKKHPFVTAYWYRRYRRDERIFPVYSIGINRYVFPRDQGQRKNRRPRSNGPRATLRITYARVSFVESRVHINRTIWGWPTSQSEWPLTSKIKTSRGPRTISRRYHEDSPNEQRTSVFFDSTYTI